MPLPVETGQFAVLQKQVAGVSKDRVASVSLRNGKKAAPRPDFGRSA
jgi:hypothetical protein